ncbi:hypothetical protein COCCADRAFT_92544 [Bipolaris zeicola 26-R-13]|uniref:Uncharacterized protein n=1 Tax=Cochliobolus carbonum (strain 26-R-13) TaxID=930089 RepID=W6YB91_COCC2|nr:uncharacterized protein COCCADRAFT_92544 [Bipolaris zeicola 26-R-13]EUC34790.1 hypothetical protein COCCADRAFT_92544 [Bipolaris zeicola 26-R-13]
MITLGKYRTLLVGIETFRYHVVTSSAKYVCRHGAYSKTEFSTALVSSPDASLTTNSGR